MPLEVRTHVARDLLQSAAMFKNERLVVWEYVSNGLDYVDTGVKPVVKVKLDSRAHRISVEDNGRGMDWPGLENFFVMHGENVDRKAGRRARGRFGTGKSAAFGIGDVLRITTVRNGKRSQVELCRSDLEAMAGGDPVPVREIDRELPDPGSNGTRIEIEGVQLRSLDQSSVIAYIERHLAHWPKDVTVLVNNHQCEFAEPPLERTMTFTPDESASLLIGEATLTVKISKVPLGDDLRGIAIFADGVWHETTLLTSAGKDMSEFIFGEIDVKRLDSDSSTPAAFDASRSMKLNPENPLVSAIFGFLGPRIEEIRKELVAAHREQRASAEAKRLSQEASKIEDIINQDFDSFRRRIQKVRAAGSGSGFDAGEGAGGSEEGDGAGDDDFLFGGDTSASTNGEGALGAQGDDSEGGNGGPPRRLNPIVEPDDDGSLGGHHQKQGSDKSRFSGGFQVEFEHQGNTSARAVYLRERRTIFVNLDNPQIAAALKSHGVEDPVFRRLAYEVAFCEYAVALAVELDGRQEFLDPMDAIVQIRETVNRIALASAALYA